MLAGGEAAAPSSAEASLQHQRRKTARQCGGVWRGSKKERNEEKQRGTANSGFLPPPGCPLLVCLGEKGRGWHHGGARPLPVVVSTGVPLGNAV